jgi:hypothetical protein
LCPVNGNANPYPNGNGHRYPNGNGHRYPNGDVCGNSHGDTHGYRVCDSYWRTDPAAKPNGHYNANAVPHPDGHAKRDRYNGNVNGDTGWQWPGPRRDQHRSEQRP